ARLRAPSRHGPVRLETRRGRPRLEATRNGYHAFGRPMTFSKEDAVQYLVSRGLSPVAAAGLVGNMGAESGYDPGINERSGGGGFGLLQWTGPRRAALTQYAADTGSSPSDPYVQMDFALKELATSEKRAGAMLAGATNADEANAGALAFLRPQGWTPDG